MEENKTVHVVDPGFHREDEIDIYKIWLFFMKYKFHILAITLTCTFIAIAYILFMPDEAHQYQTSLVLVHPHEHNAVELNMIMENTGIKSLQTNYSQEKLHNMFLQNLLSHSLKEKFNDSNKKLFQYKSLRRDVDNGVDTVIYLIESNPEVVSKSLNSYVDFANSATIKSIIEVIQNSIAYKKDEINREIKIAREFENLRRKDAESILMEAYSIAKKLNIIEPSANSIYINLNNPESSNHLQLFPIYSRGTKALLLELEALQNRENNDPYVNNLRKLEKELSRLELLSEMIALHTDINAIRVDQYADVQKINNFSSTSKIIFLGFALGLMLGIFFAILLNTINKIRDYEKLSLK